MSKYKDLSHLGLMDAVTKRMKMLDYRDVLHYIKKKWGAEKISRLDEGQLRALLVCTETGYILPDEADKPKEMDMTSHIRKYVDGKDKEPQVR